MNHWINFSKQQDLNLDHTFNSGQIFSWVRTKNNHWIGVINSDIYELKSDTNEVYFRILNKKEEYVKEAYICLKNYFNLDINLNKLYKEWHLSDIKMGKLCNKYKGLRLINQDPFECFVSFMCSSNNNIIRIKSLVNKLRIKYGTRLYISKNNMLFNEPTVFYEFPSLLKLAKVSENELKNLGFGYRSKYISNAIKKLYTKEVKIINKVNRQKDLSIKILSLKHFKKSLYLNSLKNKPTNNIRLSLSKFPGIGYKIADCISLYSLKKFDVFPIDTHIIQVYKSDYNITLKTKTLTKKNYLTISKFFQEKFGKHAGWAQLFLFIKEII